MKFASMFKTLIQKKIIKTVFLVLLITVFSFFIADFVLADTNWPVKIIGGIVSAIVYILGWILMLVVKVLVYVAQYNNFIHAKPIVVGWIMTRDLANMFFIVILLIIAFATILRIEKYNYKKWLPKLLLMAVLINFSKTITGLLIDVAQIVMLSFVNSFKDIGNYNFTTLLGIDGWGQFKDISRTDSNWDILAAYGLMLVYTIISLVVMIAMTAMLMMRIVMIWVYVVLSPLAFLLGAFPDGQSYASKWWTQFSQNLIIGPVLAFFIWLSFMTVNPDSKGYAILDGTEGDLSGPVGGHDATITEEEKEKKGVGGVGTADTLLRFFVSIAMLLGGMKIAQEIGGEAGNALGKVSKKGFDISKKASKRAAIGSAKLAGRSSLGAYAKTSKYLEKQGVLKEGKKLPGSEFAGKWREDIKKSRTKKRVENRAAFLQKMGIGEQAGDHLATTLKEKHDKRFNITQQAATKISAAPRARKDLEKDLTGSDKVRKMQTISAPGMYDKSNKSDLAQKEKLKMVNNTEVLKTYSDWLNNKGDFVDGQGNEKGFYGDKTDQDKVDAMKAWIEDAKEDPNFIKSGNKGAVDKLEADLKAKSSQIPKPYSREGEQRETKKDEDIQKIMKDVVDAIKQATGGGQPTAPNSPPPSPNYRLSANAAQAGAVGEGNLAISSFGGKNKEDVVGLDFSELQAKGLNFQTDALGANINKGEHGALMQEVAKHLIDKISSSQLDVDKNRDELDEKFEKKEISKEDYTKEQKNLDYKQEYLSQAKTRLKDGDYESLNLVNTAHPSNTRDEKLQTAYHEKIHSEGVEDEYVTESISKSLMKNQLYGRNKETGKRHVVEVSQMAKQMQDEGLNEHEIVQKIDQEVKNRSKNEASSRADRVLKKEKGDLPTEAQELKDLEAKDYNKMSKEELNNEYKEAKGKLSQAEKEGKSDQDLEILTNNVYNIEYASKKNDLVAKYNKAKEELNKAEKEGKNDQDLEALLQKVKNTEKEKNDLDNKHSQTNKRSYSPEVSFDATNQESNSQSNNKRDKQKASATQEQGAPLSAPDSQQSLDVKVKSDKKDEPQIKAEINTEEINSALRSFESNLSSHLTKQKGSSLGSGFSSQDQNNLLLKIKKAMLKGDYNLIKSVNNFNSTNNAINKKVTLAVIQGMLKDIDLDK